LFKTLIRKIFVVIVVIAGNFVITRAQSVNYEVLFGDDWKKAQSFIEESREWMEPALQKNNIPYPLAIAIVFPELVRYSALRDKMEITLLKALYVNIGQDYANFSVGQFQMKPSFAEIIREESHTVLGRKSKIAFREVSEFDDIKNFRKSIVSDLEDPETEFNYLIAFLKIAQKKFKTNRKDEISRLKFLATAYNFGIDKSAAQIEAMINKKFFNTKLFKTENYCYQDVAVFWYEQYKKAQIH
jgi:hypothetical protein